MNVYLSLFGLVPRRIGGSEVFARELSLQLARLGWRSVLCFSAPPAEPVRACLNLPNVFLEVIPCTGAPGLASVPRGFRVLMRHRPDIVHLHYVALASPWPHLARAAGAQRVFQTDHTSRRAGFVPAPVAGWKRHATRILARPLREMLTVSDYGSRCLRESGVLPPGRIRRIYNGVDLSAAGDGESFRRRYGIPPGVPLVIQVGNLIPEKGAGDFIDAARIVLAARPSARFLLIGAGPWRDAFAQRARSLGISHAVTFTGLLNDPVREGAYAAADIVCQVSRWEEAFGFTIAEAMAASKVVIGTAVGGIPELIRDGENGCLVPRGDPESVALQILRLIDDSALRRALGVAARASAEARFDIRDRVADLLRATGVLPS